MPAESSRFNLLSRQYLLKHYLQDTKLLFIGQTSRISNLQAHRNIRSSIRRVFHRITADPLMTGSSEIFEELEILQWRIFQLDFYSNSKYVNDAFEMGDRREEGALFIEHFIGNLNFLKICGFELFPSLKTALGWTSQLSRRLSDLQKAWRGLLLANFSVVRLFWLEISLVERSSVLRLFIKKCAFYNSVDSTV